MLKGKTHKQSKLIALLLAILVGGMILSGCRSSEEQDIPEDVTTNEESMTEEEASDDSAPEVVGDGGEGGCSFIEEMAEEEILIWSFSEDAALQALAVGHLGVGGAFDGISPAMLVSGGPLITVVEHGTENGQIALQLSNRAENWYTLDFLFEGLDVVRGGSYRFIARGRIEEGSGSRAMQWNQTDAPWNTIDGSRVSVSGDATTWQINVSMSREQINMALQSGQRGMRIQTDNAPTETLTIDDVFVYQIGDINLHGLVELSRWDLELPSLATLLEPYFSFGNIYSTHTLMTAFDTDAAFLHHFNAVTAENAHKPDHIAGPGNLSRVPSPAGFNFTSVDSIVNWAIEHELLLVGHALVWHGQSPNWLFREVDGSPLTREEAKERMAFYMRTLSEHFTEQGTLGAFYSWDVVNEAISSDGGVWRDRPGNWRTQMRADSPWLLAFANGADEEAGEHASDFIFYAFYYARRYFPFSILYYNDYNEEIPAKREAIAQMVEEINEQWKAHPDYDGRLLIEAIGMQSHYHLEGWTTNLSNVPIALDRFIATGARVSVTELDITLGGSGSAAHPYLNEEQLQRQAEAYARVFGYYLERANYLSRVSVWGMADHKSWRGNGFPLLFNNFFQAKPAFYAIVDLVVQWDVERPLVGTLNMMPHTWEPMEQGSRIFSQIVVEREFNDPVWFYLAEGELPSGVVLHARTGVLEGTTLETGEFTFTIGARSYWESVAQEMTIQID